MLDLLFVLTALGWLCVSTRVVLGSRAVPDLGPETGSERARVTVVIAVRDGAEEIGPTLDALVAQRGIGLQIVAVDDRSTDATSRILATHADRDPRISIVRVDQLPAGWLGKAHACDRGAAAAQGTDWLLFLDADSRLGPDVIARAVHEAQRARADHLCLVPGLDGQSWAGRALLVTLSLGLFLRAFELARKTRRKAFGVGAFTLIRREVYRAVGGHAALRMNVIEDCDLARNVLAAGHESVLRMAVADLRVRWITDVPSAFRLLEKNFFALFGFRTLLALSVVAIELAAVAVPGYGAIVGSASGWFAAASFASITLVGILVARRYRQPPLLAVTVPLLFPLVPLILLNSVVRTLLRGGVRWRETFYPLRNLRQLRTPAPERPPTPAPSSGTPPSAPGSRPS